MTLRLGLAAPLALALVPAAAHAASQPRFPAGYSGTISGSIASSANGLTRKVSWTVKDIRFKLIHARQAEGSWSGYYKITAGTVHYTETTQDGADCAYTIDDSFALRPAIPRNYPSTPFFMTRNLLGREYYDGVIDPAKKWTVTDVCTSDDAAAQSPTRTIDAPNLFNTGERRGRIGGSLTGKHVTKDEHTQSTTTYKWSLRPRR
jgi:hypothetical protein